MVELNWGGVELSIDELKNKTKKQLIWYCVIGIIMFSVAVGIKLSQPSGVQSEIAIIIVGVIGVFVFSLVPSTYSLYRALVKET